MPDWKTLRHAYGSAEDLPGILNALVADPEAGVWDELWSRVCHQGTTYSASPAVLPYLLEAARQWSPQGRVMPLFLAGAIVSARETNLDESGATREQLRLLALETLNDQNLSRTDLIYLMQAVMALEGDRVWGRAFERLTDGELLGRCPACRADLYFVIGEMGGFCAAGEWIKNADVPKELISPSEPANLDDTGRRLYQIAAEHGDSTLGLLILHAFGTTRCPNCHTSLRVPRAVAEFEGSGD